jgi:single-strand DNA-binding protein
MLQVTAAGKLGRDAELRTTQQGTRVLGFSLAVDVGFGQHKKTEWLDCAVWGDRAEKLAPYLLKGQSVTVIGEGGLRTWEKNGKNGAAITVNVRELALQGGGKRDDGQAQQHGGDASGWGNAPGLDDEIPF